MSATTLFLIDPQLDFIDDPEYPGALAVPGSFSDMNNVVDLIYYHGDRINRIVVTLDQHPPNHIAHAAMWVDRNGKNPAPFTVITGKDVKAGNWRASIPNLESIQSDYVEAAEALGEVLCIWPQHCLIGSRGANVFGPLGAAMLDWWKPGRDLLLFPKSGVWCSEQFSSFQTAVEVPDEPSTLFNWQLLDAIMPVQPDDQILIAGEALGHCVAATVLDAINWTHKINLASRLVILRDCTSSVKGSEQRGRDFLTDFQRRGGRVASSTEIWADPMDCGS